MSEPLISIIVTCYNIENYIEQTIQSIKDQTLQDYEVIVVDDASTDNTFSRIQESIEGDERFSVYRFEENTPGGAGIPSNYGIRNAKGKYIGFLDGDDWCEPDIFRLLTALAEEHEADVSFCNYLEFDEFFQKTKKPADFDRWKNFVSFLEQDDDDSDTVEQKKQFLKMVAVPWRKIYRREFLEENKILFPEGDFFYEDNPLHWYTSILAKKTVWINEVGFYHRVQRAGQTMSTANPALFKMFIHAQTIKEFLYEKNLFDQYLPNYMLWVFAQFSWIRQKAGYAYPDEFYDALVPVFEDLPYKQIKNAMKRAKINRQSRSIVWALKLKNKEKFKEYLYSKKKIKLKKYIILHLKAWLK